MDHSVSSLRASATSRFLKGKACTVFKECLDIKQCTIRPNAPRLVISRQGGHSPTPASCHTPSSPILLPVPSPPSFQIHQPVSPASPTPYQLHPSGKHCTLLNKSIYSPSIPLWDKDNNPQPSIIPSPSSSSPRSYDCFDGAAGVPDLR